MSDPPKSVPTFSFGAPTTSGGSSNLFAQNSTNTPKPLGSGPFDTNNNPPTTSGSNSSSNNPGPASISPLFGSNTQKPSVFGGGQQGSGGGSTFGTSGPSPQFSGFSTPNKPAETTSAGQNPGWFGSAGSGALSGQANATPASKQTGFAFGSTTPAGPPPPSNAGAGGATGSVFGVNKSQEANSTNPNSLFGNFGAAKSSAQNPGGTTAPSNPFSGFSQPSGSGTFGSSKPFESNVTSSSAQPSSGSLAASQNMSGSNLFGNKTNAPLSGGDLFGNLNKPQEGGDGKPQEGAAKPSLFPNLGGQSLGATPSSSTPSTTTKPAFSFPPASSQPTVEIAAATPTTASSNFGLFGQTTASGSSTTATTTASTTASTGGSFSLGGAFTAPSTTASASSIFSNVGKDKTKTLSTSDQNANTSSVTAPSSTSVPGPSANVFGNQGTQATSTATSQPTTQAPTTSNQSRTGPSNTSLGASTSGPPPTAQSRLKNKSMDEIITRWASDLSKYQKEFQKQAERVAAWDRMLVENSEKIQKLYGSTLEAERATTEVERQLTAVENDQKEVEIWLDYYEKEVEKLTTSHSHGESLQGPDQERERTYKLAEKLSDRLDEMGKDLGSMIEEINDASSSLNKNSKADDPLSQVVRVLNSHLTQLQQIDQGAAALQLKVAAAQKAGQNMGASNGFNGPISDAADGFYRSYMGRR